MITYLLVLSFSLKIMNGKTYKMKYFKAFNFTVDTFLSLDTCFKLKFNCRKTS